MISVPERRHLLVKAQRKGFRKPCSLPKKISSVSIKVDVALLSRVNKLFCTCIIRCKANRATIKQIFLLAKASSVSVAQSTPPFSLSKFGIAGLGVAFTAKIL